MPLPLAAAGRAGGRGELQSGQPTAGQPDQALAGQEGQGECGGVCTHSQSIGKLCKQHWVLLCKTECSWH